jgi:hypothetical protein
MARSSSILLLAYMSVAAVAARAQEPGQFITADPALGQPPGQAMPAQPAEPGQNWAKAFGLEVEFGRLYAQGELLYMLRDNRSATPATILVLGAGGSSFPGTTVLSTGAPEFNMEAGARATIGWRATPCDAFELTYFGIFGMNASATATGDNSLAIPGDLGLASLDFFAAERMTLEYSAQLHNVELNYFYGDGAVQFLAGFRYVALDETFDIRSTDTDTGTSNYNIRSANDLYGGQIGLRAQHCHTFWHWTFTGKAGMFGNRAEQNQFVTDFPPGFFLRDLRGSSTSNMAFVGDLNLSVARQITEVWAIRGGYSMIWIEGVALAPNQLDFTNTPTSGTDVHTNGGVFIHGANLGLEARW